MHDHILQGLNSFQLDAVKTTEGPMLILAGAGSGKTRVITRRIAYLISCAVPDFSILALTFTNKAAAEMKSRVAELLNKNSHNLCVKTFHSFGAQFLRSEHQFTSRTPSFSIYDSDDTKKIIKQIVDKSNLDKKVQLKTVINAISSIKNRFIAPDSISDFFPFIENIRAIFVEYENYLSNTNSYDFDDLISKPVVILRENEILRKRYEEKFQYIMVDEFQDTNYAQLSLLKLLTQSNNNICVVGDEDQSIYKWRGAELQNILKFPKTYKDTRVIDLKYNYRSTKKIVGVAQNLIKYNNERFKKEIIANSDAAGDDVVYKVSENDNDAIDYIIDIIKKTMVSKGLGYSDFAILYRVNSQTRPLEKKLKGVLPYKITGGFYFYERQEIKDLTALLKVLVNPKDIVSFVRVLSNLYNGIGKTTIEKVLDLIATFNLDPIDACLKASDITKKNTGNILKKIHSEISELKKILQENSLYNFTEYLFDEFSYVKQLKSEAQLTKDDEVIDRLENIKELKLELIEFAKQRSDEGLNVYLSEIALQTQYREEKVDSVNLMTLHAAKGLEFDTVFIFGFEDGIIPLIREFDYEDDVDIEEERRLLYVGITRAKKNLYLIKRNSRDNSYNSYFGESRFLSELGKNSISIIPAFSLNKTEPKHTQSQPISTFGKEKAKYPLKNGTRVIHPIFGMGEVIDFTGPYSDPCVKINFVQSGIKKLLFNVSKITRI